MNSFLSITFYFCSIVLLIASFSPSAISMQSPAENKYDTDLSITHLDISLKTDFQSNNVPTVVKAAIENTSQNPVDKAEFWICNAEWNDLDFGADVQHIYFLDDNKKTDLNFTIRKNEDNKNKDNEFNIYEIPFPQAMKPGEKLEMEFEYTMKGKSDYSSTPIAQSYDNKEEKELYLRGSDWKWCLSLYTKKEGFPHLPPTWTLRMEYPTGYKAVADGDLVEREEKEGITKDMWTSLENATPHVFIGKYMVVKRILDGLTLEVYCTDEDLLAKATDKLNDYIKIFNLYVQWYGHPGPSIYRIVGGGTEWSRSGGNGMVMGQVIDKKLLESKELVGHEMAHAWWGNLISTYGEGGKFLTEAMAEYSMNYVLGTLARDESVRDNFIRSIKSLVFCHYFTLSNPATLCPLIPQEGYNPQEVAKANYRKGPLVANQIRLILGDGIFFKSMKYFVLRSKNKKVNIEDFIDTINRVSGRDITSDLKNLLWSAGYPSYRLVSFDSTPKGSSYSTKVRIQNVGEYGLDCPLSLKMATGEKREIIKVDGREEREFEYITKYDVIDVVIDPEQTTFQYHPKQNIRLWKALDLNAPPFKGGKVNWVWYGKSYMYYSLGEYKKAVDTITEYFSYDMVQNNANDITELVRIEGLSRPYLFMRGIYFLAKGDKEHSEEDIKAVFPYLLTEPQERIMYLVGAIPKEDIDQCLALLSLIAGREFAFENGLDDAAKKRKIEEWRQWWEKEGKQKKLNLDPLKKRYEENRKEFRSTLGLAE